MAGKAKGRPTLEDIRSSRGVSRDFIAANPEIYGQDGSRSPVQAVSGPGDPSGAPQEAKKAPEARQMTQTEAEYEAMLKRNYPEATILWEAYTLRLARNLNYKPDFAVIMNATISFHEVKGPHLFKGATESHTRATLTKPRTAKSLYPWHGFYIARKDKLGNWTVEELFSA